MAGGTNHNITLDIISHIAQVQWALLGLHPHAAQAGKVLGDALLDFVEPAPISVNSQESNQASHAYVHQVDHGS